MLVSSGDEAAVSFPGYLRTPVGEGTSARSELVPRRALTRMRVHVRPLRVLLAVIDAKTLHESRL